MINLKSQPPRPRQRTHQPSYPAKLALGASVVALAAACGGVIESGADDTGNQLLGDQESSETTPEPRSETEKGGHGGEYGNEGGGATADNWEEEPEMG